MGRPILGELRKRGLQRLHWRESQMSEEHQRSQTGGADGGLQRLPERGIRTNEGLQRHLRWMGLRSLRSKGIQKSEELRRLHRWREIQMIGVLQRLR